MSTPVELLAQLVSIPEVVALKRVSDHNRYHIEKNAFVHTCSVVDQVKQTLQDWDFVSDGSVRAGLEGYFFQLVGRYNRGGLLRVGTWLHDIGKGMRDAAGKPVMRRSDDGRTCCPDHSEVGAAAAFDLLGNLGLKEVERAYVRDVILHHMRPLRLYTGLSTTSNPEKSFAKFKRKVEPVYLDVLVHARADRLGGILAPDCSFPRVTFRGKTYESDQPFIEDLIATAL